MFIPEKRQYHQPAGLQSAIAEMRSMKTHNNVPQTASSKAVAIYWENINCCGWGPAFACVAFRSPACVFEAEGVHLGVFVCVHLMCRRRVKWGGTGVPSALFCSSALIWDYVNLSTCQDRLVKADDWVGLVLNRLASNRLFCLSDFVTWVLAQTLG